MKSVLLTVFAALCCYSASATDYYFSNSGDDSRTATAASNPATPWKTINKLNAFFPSLKPGDRVLFKSGEVFFGRINVTKSGTSTDPITIGAYGTGAKPVITGYTTVSNWVSTGNGNYEVVNSSFPDRIRMVTMNGAPKAMGRWPNANASLKGYMIIESASSNSITDKELTSTPNWTGAEIVIRTSHWTLDRGLISGHSGSTINFTEPESVGTPKVNYGYFIQNHIRTLDQLGEWAYDKSTRKLTMHFGSNSPSNYRIRVNVQDDLVYNRNMSYIVYDGLAFEGANESAFYLVYANRNIIRNCDISNSGMYGVEAYGSDYVTVEKCDINNTNNTGIYLKGETDRCQVLNNKVTNTGTWPGMGGNGSNTDMGMRINGDYNMVANNTIDSSGYCGMRFTGNYTEMRNNLIRYFALTKDDAGGIYTGSEGTEYFGRKIINNIITDGIGAKEGTNTSTVQQVSGIYLDNNSSGVEVIGNTTARCGKVGIYIHNAYKIKVFDNLSYDNTAQVMLNHDDQTKAAIRQIVMKRNIFISKTPSQVVAYFYTKANDISQFGIIDSNFYQRPLDENITVQTATYLYTSSQVLKRYSFDQWKSAFSMYDAHSKKSNITYSSTTNPDGVFKFIYNASSVAKTYALNGTYVCSRNKQHVDAITVGPFESAVLMLSSASAPTSTTTTNQAPTVALTSPTSSSSFTTGSSISLAATANDADGSISKVEFYRGTTLLNTQQSAPYAFTWTNVPAGTYTLTAKAYDNAGKVTTSTGVNITVGTSTNAAPVVSLTSPKASSTYSSGGSIRITATASDADGSIKKVEFYRGSTLLVTEWNAAYDWTWTNVPAGTYTITAKAYDNAGKVTTSAGVTVTVKSSTTASISGVQDEVAMMVEEDYAAAARVKLFPNPATTNLNVQLGSGVSGKDLVMAVSDLNGRLVLRQQVAAAGSVVNLNIGHLPSGVYILNIVGEGTRVNEKFVKQ